MKLKEITQPFVEKSHASEERIANIKAKIKQRKKQIQRLENKLSKEWNNSPSWVNEIVGSIAKELLPKLSGYSNFEILGPFGIPANIGIHFIKDGTTCPNRGDCENWEKERKKYFKKLRSITFVPLDLDIGTIGWRDYNIDTGKYGKGSIGEMNDENYPVNEINPECEIADLIKLAKI